MLDLFFPVSENWIRLLKMKTRVHSLQSALRKTKTFLLVGWVFNFYVYCIHMDVKVFNAFNPQDLQITTMTVFSKLEPHPEKMAEQKPVPCCLLFSSLLSLKQTVTKPLEKV